MKTLLIVLPLFVFGTSWLLGAAQMGRALAALIVWTLICVGAYLYIVLASFQSSNLGMLMFAPLVALLIAMPIFWIALLWSVLGKPVTPAPVVQIAEAYQGLDDKHKELVHGAIRKGAPIIARGFANYLDKKGWGATAGALRETSHLL